MKRYISLTLAAVVLVVSLAVPSHAAENSFYVDALDYGTANNGSNFTNYRSGSTTFVFELPSAYVPQGYDILFYSGHAPDRMYIDEGHSQYDLTVYSLGNYMYRAVLNDGYIDGSNVITLVIEDSRGDWIDFLSAKMFVVPNKSFTLPAYGLVSYGNGEENTFYYRNDNDYSGCSFPGTDNWLDDAYRAYITLYDVTKFDRIDLQVYLRQLSISSISVTIGNQNIPFTYSYLQSEYTLDSNLVNISIDSFNLAEYSGTMQITILGDVAYFDEAISSITILYSSGFVYANDPSVELHFHNKLVSFLSTQFNNISTFFTNLSSSISTNFSNWFSSLSSWIGDNTALIRNDLRDWFTSLWSWLDTNTKSITASISSWGQAIVDAINGDASDADDFKQQVDDSNKELNDMAAVMDSFTTPNIDSINVDVGSFVSSSDISSLTAPMAMLFESDLIVTCIMISIIMATVMFVLYGKR